MSGNPHDGGVARWKADVIRFRAELAELAGITGDSDVIQRRSLLRTAIADAENHVESLEDGPRQLQVAIDAASRELRAMRGAAPKTPRQGRKN